MKVSVAFPPLFGSLNSWPICQVTKSLTHLIRSSRSYCLLFPNLCYIENKGGMHGLMKWVLCVFSQEQLANAEQKHYISESVIVWFLMLHKSCFSLSDIHRAKGDLEVATLVLW